MKGVELVRGEHVEGGVPSGRVVAALDPFEDRSGQLGAGVPVVPVEQSQVPVWPSRK